MTTYTDIILKDTANNYFIPYGLINRLGDVNISNPTQGQSLTYDATNNVWKNTSSSATVGWGGITGNLSDQTDLNNALSSKLENTATGSGSITIGSSYSATNPQMINIGKNSEVRSQCSIALGEYAIAGYTSSDVYATAIGHSAKAQGVLSTALGANASATSQRAIQIGSGTNSTSNSFSVGFGSSNNYQLLDGTTGYIPNDRLIGLLETIYPVGALYIGTTSTCPLASLFGTWTLVAQDKALWTGDGTNADTTIAAKLPNIKGGLQSGGVPGSTWDSNVTTVSGAFSKSGSSSYASRGTNLAAGSYLIRADFNAANSNSIYSDDATTVQPPSYVVNVWKRTA